MCSKYRKCSTRFPKKNWPKTFEEYQDFISKYTNEEVSRFLMCLVEGEENPSGKIDELKADFERMSVEREEKQPLYVKTDQGFQVRRGVRLTDKQIDEMLYEFSIAYDFTWEDTEQMKENIRLEEDRGFLLKKPIENDEDDKADQPQPLYVKTDQGFLIIRGSHLTEAQMDEIIRDYAEEYGMRLEEAMKLKETIRLTAEDGCHLLGPYRLNEQQSRIARGETLNQSTKKEQKDVPTKQKMKRASPKPWHREKQSSEEIEEEKETKEKPRDRSPQMTRSEMNEMYSTLEMNTQRTNQSTEKASQYPCSVCEESCSWNNEAIYEMECNTIAPKWYCHSECLEKEMKSQGLTTKRKDFRKAFCFSKCCDGKGHLLAIQKIRKGGEREKIFIVE